MTARCRWFTHGGANGRDRRNAAVGVQVGEGPKSTTCAVPNRVGKVSSGADSAVPAGRTDRPLSDPIRRRSPEIRAGATRRFRTFRPMEGGSERKRPFLTHAPNAESQIRGCISHRSAFIFLRSGLLARLHNIGHRMLA